MPEEISVANIWWQGPPWLQEEQSLWPRRPDINLGRELPEIRASVLLVSVGQVEMGTHISSYSKLV